MKKMRAFIASFLAVATLFTFTGCSSFKVIDDEDVFFDALEDAVGIDKDETTHASLGKSCSFFLFSRFIMCAGGTRI